MFLMIMIRVLRVSLFDFVAVVVRWLLVYGAVSTKPLENRSCDPAVTDVLCDVSAECSMTVGSEAEGAEVTGEGSVEAAAVETSVVEFYLNVDCSCARWALIGLDLVLVITARGVLNVCVGSCVLSV